MRRLHFALLLGLTAARPAVAAGTPDAACSRSARARIGSGQGIVDGTVPPVNVDGNFILGPTHSHAAEIDVQPGVPQGTVHDLTMKSIDSKIYPGIARETKRLAR